jgi:hypothetical protein
MSGETQQIPTWVSSTHKNYGEVGHNGVIVGKDPLVEQKLLRVTFGDGILETITTSVTSFTPHTRMDSLEAATTPSFYLETEVVKVEALGTDKEGFTGEAQHRIFYGYHILGDVVQS